MDAFQFVTLFLWLGLFHANVFVLGLELFFLPHPAAFAALVVHVLLAFFPRITHPYPRWGKRLAGAIVRAAIAYFPLTVECEDSESFLADQPYLIGLAPHGVLPASLAAFGEGGNVLPAELNKEGRRVAHATSAAFHVPLLRHIWSWLGLCPVSRPEIAKHLKNNKACILLPGGVAEVVYLDKEVETIFLRKRTGFVKLALQHGAPLVPAFAFGQIKVYSWMTLLPRNIMLTLSRTIGFAPLLFWGVLGGPLPKQHPIKVVIGKPINVPKEAQPSKEDVAKYLDLFIKEMERIFEKHKGTMPDCPQKIKIV